MLFITILFKNLLITELINGKYFIIDPDLVAK